MSFRLFPISLLNPLLSVTFVLLVSGTASATDVVKGEFEVAPLVGYTWPIDDTLDGGFAFGAQGLYCMAPWVGAGIAVNHNRFGIGTNSAGRLGITEILVIGKARIPLDARTTPYGKVAAGLLVDAVSGSDVGAIGAGAALGLGGGVGLQSRFGQNWGLFGETVIMVHIGDDTFSFLSLRVGANFYFGGGRSLTGPRSTSGSPTSSFSPRLVLLPAVPAHDTTTVV